MRSPFLRAKFDLALWVLIAGATLGLSAWAHMAAGFTLPSPWNDEPWYLWSVVSMVQDGTYFSEMLNPERIVLMSPYYQAPLMLLFKIVGFSYRLARDVSWCYMALAYAGILMLVRRRPFPLLSAGVASLFFLGATAVVAGNMVRPEAMVWAMVVWSFVLGDRGHLWKALALSGVAVLVHQIALVFFGGILLLFLLEVWRKRGCIRPTRSDWIVMAGAAVLLGVHVYWMIQFWGTTMADSQAAMNEGLGGNTVWDRLFLSNKTPWLAVYGGLLGLSLWRFRKLLAPVMLGGCAYSTMLLRPQMWYEIYNQMAFLWLALLIPWTLVLGIGNGLSRWKPTMAGWLRTGLLLGMFGAGCLPMLKMSYNHGFVTGPNHYPAKLGWGWGMRMDPAPYITEQDIQAVLGEIEKHVGDGKRYRVFFMPEADGLFFQGRMPFNAIPYQGARTGVLGDMAVFRLSRHPPAWWTDQHVLKSLRIYGGEGIEPFYERDGTEKWILVPPDYPLPPSSE